MAKISDIINARSQDNVIPERIRSARDTTTGATDELYTNNVIEALGGDSNLPNWIKDVKTVKNPTIPVVNEIVKVLGLDDDEGAKQGKGRTAVDKFIEDFPKFQKDWKDAVEGVEHCRGNACIGLLLGRDSEHAVVYGAGPVPELSNLAGSIGACRTCGT